MDSLKETTSREIITENIYVFAEDAHNRTKYYVLIEKRKRDEGEEYHFESSKLLEVNKKTLVTLCYNHKNGPNSVFLFNYPPHKKNKEGEAIFPQKVRVRIREERLNMDLNKNYEIRTFDVEEHHHNLRRIKTRELISEILEIANLEELSGSN